MPFNTYRNEFENTLEVSANKKQLEDLRTVESARIDKGHKMGGKINQLETQRIQRIKQALMNLDTDSLKEIDHDFSNSMSDTKNFDLAFNKSIQNLGGQPTITSPRTK